MAPKKPLKTGGKAGAVPSRPGKPMAGLRDKSARVPASWNAKTVDPTNQRGAGQRPTGGMAGGRAGKPAGKIAGQTPKPAAKPSGQFKAPSVPKPGTPSPRIKVPAEFNARTIYSGANKPRPGAPTTVEGRMAARGPLDAPGAPVLPNARSPRAAVKEMRTSIADVRPANKPAAKPAAAAKPTAKPAATTPRVRTTTSYGPPANQIKPKGAGQNSLLSNLRNAATKVTSKVKGGAMLGKVGKFGGKLLGPVAMAADAFVTAKDVFNPNDNIIHGLGNLGTAVENAISGKDSGRRYSGNSPVAKAGNIKRGLNKPAAKPAASTSRFAGARDKAFAKAKAIKGSPVVGPKPASAPARMSAPADRSSAPSAPRAAAPKASAPKASAPKSAGPARMSASTYNRVSGNYGTSRSNNPLMADFKDSLPSKAADPDAGYSPKTKVSSKGIKGAPTDVTKLAFSNPKLSAERTRKIKRG